MRVSCIILAVTFATTSAFDCPQSCDCRLRQSSGAVTDLTVACVEGEVNESILARELDLLLSGVELRENLTSLNISNTPLTEVPVSVCQLTNLRRLYLDRNRLNRLPYNCFTSMTTLYSLSARYNNITELQDGIFDGLNSLRRLDFARNNIASIGHHVFSNPSDLVSLYYINLDYNLLSSLEPWPYIRGLHGSISAKVDISIKSNFIYKFTNNVEWQTNCSYQPSYATVNIADNYVQHLLDILIGWNISLHEWRCIMYRDADYFSRVHEPAFDVDFAFSHNYQCNCFDIVLIPAMKNEDMYNMFKDVKCSRPSRLANQSATDIPPSEFVCELSDRCPANCRCICRPIDSALLVNCSAATLSSLPLDLPLLPPSYTYTLNFSNNRLLERLEYRPYFVNTSVLDVSNCSIYFVDLSAWQAFSMMPSRVYFTSPYYHKHFIMYVPRNVTPVVFLHENKIESLSFDITDVNLTSVYVTLHDNPWKCSCDSRWMIAWFKYLSSGSSSSIGNVLCASPSRLTGRSIIHADHAEFCVDPLMRMLKIVLSSTLSAMACLLMLGFAVYRLRVRLYKRWKFHPFDRDECVGEDMDYDVFLCCSSDDEDPHGLRILQMIESKGYRVCYHERDFRPGLIMDNIIQSILRSKRTVCFLSSNFLRR